MSGGVNLAIPGLRAAGPGLSAAALGPRIAVFLCGLDTSEPAAPPRETVHPSKQVADEKPEPAATQQDSSKKAIVSYWGVQPRKLVREDGTE